MNNSELNDLFKNIDDAVERNIPFDQMNIVFNNAQQLINKFEYDALKFNQAKQQFHTKKSSYLRLIGKLDDAQKEEDIASRYSTTLPLSQEEPISTPSVINDASTKEKSLPTVQKSIWDCFDQLKGKPNMQPILNELKSSIESYLVDDVRSFKQYTDLQEKASKIRLVLNLSKNQTIFTSENIAQTISTSSDSPSLSQDADINSLDFLIDTCLDLYRSSFCRFLLKQKHNDIRDILFSNIPSAHERINSHTRKLTVLFHPDKVQNEEDKNDCRELFQIIITCKEELLNKLTKNGTIVDRALAQHHKEEGQKLWKFARDYSRARNGKWSKLQYLSRDLLMNDSDEDLSDNQKMYGLLAYEQYRAAALILGNQGTAEERSELRRMMAIALYTAEELLQAQLYIIAAMYILTHDTGRGPADKIDELQELLKKFQNAPTSTISPNKQQQNTPSNSSSGSGATSAERSVLTTTLQTVSVVNGQSSAIILNAYVKQELRSVLLQQCIIKSKEKQVQTAEELILRAKSRAIQKRVGGVVIGAEAAAFGGAIAVGAYNSIATGFVVGSVLGPVGACVGVAVGAGILIGGLYLGCDMVKQSQAQFHEPRKRENLNNKLKEALKYYNKKMYGPFLEELATEYWPNCHLFQILIEEDRIKIDLHPRTIISILLGHEFRPDGIAYLLNLIGEALLNKPQLKCRENKDSSLRQPLQSTMNELALNLFSEIFSASSQLKVKAEELDQQVKNKTLANNEMNKFHRFMRSITFTLYSSYAYSIPKEYFTDALLTPFATRLEELGNIARLNYAIVNIIIGGGDNFEESQNAILEIKRKQSVTANHQFHKVPQTMIQAIDDLLMAFGLIPKEWVDPELLSIECNIKLESIKNVLIGSVVVTCQNVTATSYASQQLKTMCDLSDSPVAATQTEFVEKVKQLYQSNVGQRKSNKVLVDMMIADNENDISIWSNNHIYAEKWVLSIAHLPILAKFFGTHIRSCLITTNSRYGHIFVSNDKITDENMCFNSNIFVVLDSDQKKIIGMFKTADMKLNYLYTQLSMARTNLLKCDLYRQIATAHRLSAEFHEQVHRLRALPRWNDAKLAYSQILELRPDDLSALLGFGRCLIMLSKWSKAVKSLRQTVKSNETSNEAWYLLGLAQRKLRCYDEATHAIRQSLEKQSNYAEAVSESNVVRRLQSEDMKNRLKVYNNMTISREVNRHDNSSNYNILAIDGGGIRGIIPAVWMAELERHTKRSAASMFQMMAGTSTGAILAAGLCTPKRDNVRETRYQASDIVKLYIAHSNEVFKKPENAFYNIRRYLSQEAKYVAEARHTLFKHYFDHTYLTSVLTDLVIPAVKDGSRSTHLFNKYDCIRSTAIDQQIHDVLMCTTAAPTYFSPYKLGGSQYVDGGVQMNNPTMAAYFEAIRYGKSNDDIFILSLGTGDYVPDPLHPDAQRHLLFYAAHQQEVLNIILDGPQHNLDVHMLSVIDSNKYQRWQVWFEEPIALDSTEESVIQLLFDNARAFFEEMEAYDNDKRLGLLLDRLRGDVH
jgi:predicted acylesterase/phospholipase RssA